MFFNGNEYHGCIHPNINNDAFYIKLFYRQKQNSTTYFFMLPNTAYPKQPFPRFWNQ